MNALDISRLPEIKYAEHFRAICDPLLKTLGFEYFRYVSVKKTADGLKITSLCTQPSWIKKFFENEFHTFADVTSEEQLVDMTYFWDDVPVGPSDKETAHIYDEFSKFGFNQGFSVYEETLDGWNIFAFATREKQTSFHSYVMNHDHLVQSFISYVKSQASSLMNLAETEMSRYDLGTMNALWGGVPNVKDETLQKNEVFKQALMNASIRLNGRFDGIQLSSNEIQCLYHFMRGLSAKETAGILQKSPRTIEYHLNQVRLKLGCNKTSEIPLRLNGSGLVGLTADVA